MPARTSAFARKREVACNAILDATSRIIAEKGVEGFTISEVALRAQINRALIYHYFGDRNNLVVQAIDHIIKLSESAEPESMTDSVESSARMYIEHPEIARFFFQLLLTGRPLLRLGERITDAISGLERLQEEHAPDSTYDSACELIILVLSQLSWAFSREEFARLLHISVEEADDRFIRYLRGATEKGMQAMTNAK